jgi:hypothetical protein
MLHRNSVAVPWVVLVGCLALCFALFPATVWGQQTQGTISVTVADPTGGVIPGAQLKLWMWRPTMRVQPVHWRTGLIASLT